MFSDILVPVDHGLDANKPALQKAFRLAEAFDGTVHVVHVRVETDSREQTSEEDTTVWWCRKCTEQVGTTGDEPGACSTCGSSDWKQLASRGEPEGSAAEGEAIEQFKLADRLHSQAAYDGPVQYDILYGSPGGEIANYAEEINADVVVMGTHGRSGLKRIALGSVTEYVIRNTHIPVLAVEQKKSETVNGAVESVE